MPGKGTTEKRAGFTLGPGLCRRPLCLAMANHPLVVMTLQKLHLFGSDVFDGLCEMRSRDGGTTWSAPQPLASFARRPFAWRGKTDLEITVCDFTPAWHQRTQCLLGTGHTVVYEGDHVMRVRPRSTAYAVYDASQQRWSDWRTIQMPSLPRFENCGGGCTQRVDLPNGDVLLPVYFKPPEATRHSTTIVRCTFDGETLAYAEHGSELTVPIKRGLYEPSLTQFQERFFLTMRNDDHAYVATSDDGLHFESPRRWTFDDGEDLGSYNTQQHWVTHQNGLFLVYTRRGAQNDHVFRHRAPLFIARVDPVKLQVLRQTEQVLVPEFGARLGNFGVTRVSPHETWITVTEWMQGPSPDYTNQEPLVARGADNRVWVARLLW